MPSASGTGHLDPVHAVAEIVVQLYVGAIRRLGEAGPAGPGLELRLRGEKLGAAPGATVRPVTLLVDVLAGERSLGPLVAEHLVLSRGQLLAPFAITLLDAMEVILVLGVSLVIHVWFDPGHPQNGSSGRGLVQPQAHGGGEADRVGLALNGRQATQSVQHQAQSSEQPAALNALSEMALHPDPTRLDKLSVEVCGHPSWRPPMVPPEALTLQQFAHFGFDPVRRRRGSQRPAAILRLLGRAVVAFAKRDWTGSHRSKGIGSGYVVLRPESPADDSSLDNPAYASLSTIHARFAQRSGRVLRYPDDIIRFVGLPSPATDADWDDAAKLVPPGSMAAIIHADGGLPPNWTVAGTLGLVQMVGDDAAGTGHPDVISLGPADVPEMLELVRLTTPGPFSERTIELGDYLGIRRDGALVAMAGERLHFTGWTEISAVCTAPAYRGTGMASRLMSALIAGIHRRSERPFLHSAKSNTSAIRLYEQLGFRLRRELTITLIAAA